MWLVVLDSSFKIVFYNAKTKLAKKLELYNDLYVFFGCYALFSFADGILDPETKATFGWIYIGAVFVMFFSNILILGVSKVC